MKPQLGSRIDPRSPNQRVCAEVGRIPFLQAAIPLLVLLLALVGGPAQSSPQQRTPPVNKPDEQPTRELKAGTPIERELAAGQVHTYYIELKAGQFVHLVADQRGISVTLRLIGPEEQTVAEMDLTLENGPERLSWIAGNSGLFKLQVLSLEKSVPPGRYEVRIDQLRETRAEDKTRIAAERLSAEGMQLFQKGTAESLRMAREKFEGALPLWEALKDDRGQAESLSGIGVVFRMQGQLAKALESYQRAVPLWQRLADHYGQADILNKIGYAQDSLGEKQKALEAYRLAVEAWQTVGNPRGQATTIHNMGLVHASLGDKERALEHFGRALPLWRLCGFRKGEAASLHAMGVAYYDLDQYQKALVHYQQALAIHESEGNKPETAAVLNSIALSHLKVGEWGKAMEYLKQALTLWREKGDRRGEATALRNLARVYESSGTKLEARQHYEQALALQQTIRDRDGEASTLSGLARVDRDLGHFEQARADIENALTIVESMRTKLASEQARATYLASKQKNYEFYIDLLIRQQQQAPSGNLIAEAFRASERARARSLLDLLAEANVDIREGIDPGLKEREQSVHAQVAAIQRRLFQTALQPSPDKVRITALEQDLKQVETAREHLEWEIRQNHPRYASLKYPEPVQLGQLQELLGEQSLLLEYFLGKEDSFLFAVTRNDCQAFRLPTERVLVERVNALREAIAHPGRATFSSYVVQARELYRVLVEPVHDLLLGKQELVVAADGILHYLPFEVLLKAEGSTLASTTPQNLPYLVRDLAISYIPSASVLAALPGRLEETEKPEKMFLAFADASYGQSNYRESASLQQAVRSALGDGAMSKLTRLEHSRQEVRRIAKLYPQTKTAVFLGDQANETTAKAEAGHYRIIHFAAHGLLNESQPQFSGLVLSRPAEDGKSGEARSESADMARPSSPQQPPKRTAEDGLLQVYEVFNLKLKADLVVLSACETGLGKAVRGEGLIGLTRAFFYAGTPSIVVSLWKVADQSTAELMVQFYRHLTSGEVGKAQALRQAQLDMIGTSSFAHPYYWAPFILVGRR